MIDQLLAIPQFAATVYLIYLVLQTRMQCELNATRINMIEQKIVYLHRKNGVDTT